MDYENSQDCQDDESEMEIEYCVEETMQSNKLTNGAKLFENTIKHLLDAWKTYFVDHVQFCGSAFEGGNPGEPEIVMVFTHLKDISTCLLYEFGVVENKPDALVVKIPFEADGDLHTAKVSSISMISMYFLVGDKKYSLMAPKEGVLRFPLQKHMYEKVNRWAHKKQWSNVLELLETVFGVFANFHSNCFLCGDAIQWPRFIGISKTWSTVSTCQSPICIQTVEESVTEFPLKTHLFTDPIATFFHICTFSAALSTTNGQRVEPFPTFFLKEQELRERSGWFSKGSETRDENKNVETIKKIMEPLSKLNFVSPQEVQTFFLEPYHALRQLEDTTPENARRLLMLLQFAVQSVHDPIIYLSRTLHEKFYTDVGNPSIIFLVGGSPLEELQGYKHEYVFHGSPLHNWFSIVRNGLKVTSNTKYSTTGAVLGSGVYATHQLATARGYTGYNNTHDGIKLYLDDKSVSSMTFVGIFEAMVHPDEIKEHFVIRDSNRMKLRWILGFSKDAGNTTMPKKMHDCYMEQSQSHFLYTKEPKMFESVLSQKQAKSRLYLDQLFEREKTLVWTESIAEAVSKRQQWATSRGGGAKILFQQFSHLFLHSTDFAVHLPDEDNVFRWIVQMNHFCEEDMAKPDTLANDLAKYYNGSKNFEGIVLEILFHGAHPIRPPFVRVIAPRFKALTGHVLQNGAVCSDFLTSQSWNPAYDVEQVLVTLQSIMVEGGGRLDPIIVPSGKRPREDSSPSNYNILESFQDFTRMIQTHGWKV